MFAIAITLLVLDLKVPSLTSVSPAALAEALWAGWPSYLTFVLSFATILIMWIYHHRLFQAVRRAETVLLFSNGLLLLLVTAVPFPTALVAAYLTTPAAPVACATYAGFFVLIDLAYNLLWWVVPRQQVGDRLHGRHLSPRLPLLPDCDGGSLLASLALPLHLWCSLGCLGYHGTEAAQRGKGPVLVFLLALSPMSNS